MSSTGSPSNTPRSTSRSYSARFQRFTVSGGRLSRAPTLLDRRGAVNVASRIRDQPFTDPAVRPCTMYFWKISTSSTAGSAPRKPEAAITE